MFRKLIATTPNWVTVPIRLALGAVMIGHGAQKVLGSFGGPGFEKFVSGSTPFAFMKPTWFWLGAAAVSELVGGLLIVIGLLTRVGAFFVACTMLTAIVGVHWGFFFAPRGFEYPLSLLGMAFALLIAGGGMASVDLALSRSSGGRGRRR